VKRSREEWARIFERLLADAPPCACGCGEPVRPLCGSLDAFIRDRKRGYFRYRKGHDKRPPNWSVELTPTERQAVLGTLLGDSSIGLPNPRSLNPRLTANHSAEQRAWVEHKAALLGRLGVKVHEETNRGYGRMHVRMATRCLPCLEPIRRLVAPGGRKLVTWEWLEAIGPIGLAWWICDDGGSSGRGFLLHTEGYARAEVDLIAAWFAETYGPVSVGKKRPSLYVSREARRAFLPLIEAHVPASMTYKLRACREAT
jgi:hypothetical protein